MPDTKFYYRASVIWRYVGLIAIIVLNLVDLPTTYFKFVEEYPGKLILDCVLLYLAAYLIWQLPTFVRTVFRIPAVEYDGRVLLVRGWNDQSFTVAPAGKVSFRVDKERQRVNILEGTKSAGVHMSQIDGPTSFVRFLDELLSERADDTSPA